MTFSTRALTHFAFDTHGAIGIFFDAGQLFRAERGDQPENIATENAFRRMTKRYGKISGTDSRDRYRNVIAAIGDDEGEPLHRDGALEVFDLLWPEGDEACDKVHFCERACDFLEALPQDVPSIFIIKLAKDWLTPFES